MSFSRVAMFSITLTGLALSAHAEQAAEGGQVGEMTISEKDMGGGACNCILTLCGQDISNAPTMG